MPELLTMNEVSDLVRLSRSQINILIKEDNFPSPIQLSPKRFVFEKSAVESWINNKIEKTRNSQKNEVQT